MTQKWTSFVMCALLIAGNIVFDNYDVAAVYVAAALIILAIPEPPPMEHRERETVLPFAGRSWGAKDRPASSEGHDTQTSAHERGLSK